ncbi:unnamed protein product [Didymodactylos carnosus]|uniref:Phosphatidylinositol-4-phosphate 5-kinase n=1 Tax=Didymodactylos carnosus TaxID=1234261 RepID=A0A814U5F5_9BILA|nr:unnamed protein product [Didymodactylos carnosus]CAF3932986.1 unnamed protein product [Didymodactylos carnosus]
MHGQGRHEYANGDVYEGNFDNGEHHGYGVHLRKDGTRYEGQWKDGQREGTGTLIWGSGTKWPGDKYVSSFANGEMHGQGRHEYANGDVYEGNYVEGERSVTQVAKYTFPGIGLDADSNGENHRSLADSQKVMGKTFLRGKARF